MSDTVDKAIIKEKIAMLEQDFKRAEAHANQIIGAINGLKLLLDAPKTDAALTTKKVAKAA